MTGGRKRRWKERKIGEGRVKKLFLLPLHCHVKREHPIRGNEGGRSRKEEWRVNKTGDMET